MPALALVIVLAAADADTAAYDHPTRFGVTLLGAAVGVAAPMLAGLAASPDQSIGMAAGGALGVVVSAPLLALLANRLGGGRAGAGVTLVSGWLSLFPSMPFIGAGAVLGSVGLVPQWASNALMAAGAIVASVAIALILYRTSF